MMMRKVRLPKDSRAYAELAWKEKERWHRRYARMSFERKLQVLDKLLEAAKQLPRLTPR